MCKGQQQHGHCVVNFFCSDLFYDYVLPVMYIQSTYNLFLYSTNEIYVESALKSLQLQTTQTKQCNLFKHNGSTRQV